MPADRGLLEAARRALPDARVVPIGTSARVGGVARLRGRGDGGLRRPARRRARRRARARGAGARERDRRARPDPLAVRRCAGDARVPRCRCCCGRSSVPELPPPLPPAERTVGQVDRRGDPRLRRQLLACAAARAAARGRRRSCRSVTRRRCRWSCSSRSRRCSRPRSSGPAGSTLDARPTPVGVHLRAC